ncbi:squalene epoxidase [Cadophora sp. DSE1049]|nr:squalene epoxidase [Cadophora sp. DSE1049]
MPAFSDIPGEIARERLDVLVVGAGVLGSALAVTLARQGRNVLLLERNLEEPNRIVGELLQPGGVAALQQLGMGECLEEIDAIPVEGYEIFYRGENIMFRYPLTDPVIKRRPQGRSFHHGRFIMKLREIARNEKRVHVVEATAKELLRCKESKQVIGVMCSTRNQKEQTYFADLTIVADGQASKFRCQYTKHTPITTSRFWALELIDAVLPSHHIAYGVIGSGPPILIYQIGLHETRLLIDIPSTVYEAASRAHGIKHYVLTSVIPDLPASVQPAATAALEKGGLRSMPNSWLPAAMNTTPGVAILGDAFNMRHPLTGGGMTVALNDVVLLRQLLGPEIIPTFSDTRLVVEQMSRFHWKRRGYSTSLNILAQALYTLFIADDPQLQILQRGFIRYIQLGGKCVEEPAGLMGGVIRSPWLLFYHFLSVALYSLGILIREGYALSVWHLIGAIFECFRVFAKAVVVIFPFLLSELRS